jgi:hypothetical protein
MDGPSGHNPDLTARARSRVGDAPQQVHVAYADLCDAELLRCAYHSVQSTAIPNRVDLFFFGLTTSSDFSVVCDSTDGY